MKRQELGVFSIAIEIFPEIQYPYRLQFFKILSMLNVFLEK